MASNMGRSHHGPGVKVSEHVELNIPADAALLSLTRVSVATIGSTLDLTLDEIEDLQLSVDELCLWTMARGEALNGRLGVQFKWDGQAIEVEVELFELGGAGSRSEAPNEVGASLSEQILAALVDQYESRDVEGRRVSWLRQPKRSESAAP